MHITQQQQHLGHSLHVLSPGDKVHHCHKCCGAAVSLQSTVNSTTDSRQHGFPKHGTSHDLLAKLHELSKAIGLAVAWQCTDVNNFIIYVACSAHVKGVASLRFTSQLIDAQTIRLYFSQPAFGEPNGRSSAIPKNFSSDSLLVLMQYISSGSGRQI